jgi:prepilin-type N-terminal cleavage/methylation domain-containing protein
MNATPSIRSDNGYSLAELLVVVAMLGVVLSTVYLFLGTSDGITATTQSLSTTAQALSNPPEIISKHVMQQTALTNASPYRLDVWTDRDMDANRERHSFRAEAPNRLIWEMWEYDKNSGPTILSHSVQVLSESNRNVSAAVPLFRYFDEAGVEITDMDEVASNAFAVQLAIAVDAGGGRTAQDTRDITFRNKD